MTEIFTAWDIVAKSMSVKERNLVMSQLLADKTAQDITFTAIDAEGNLEQFVLGTIEGNVKFLLGYANPGFAFAPYHLQVMDPSIPDDMAKSIYAIKGHPSIMEFWSSKGVAPFAEGDVKDGKPHPDAMVAPKANNIFKFKFRGKKYEANPDTQLVTCVTTGHIYAWALVENTYLSSQVPEIALHMNVEQELVEKKLPYPDRLQPIVTIMKGVDYAETVYPLVKTYFPKPGSIVKSGDTYALFWPSSIQLFDKSGFQETVSMWDRQVTDGMIEISKGGSVFPCVILNFAKDFLNLDLESLEQFVDG